jgi:hypothetical protein
MTRPSLYRTVWHGGAILGNRERRAETGLEASDDSYQELKAQLRTTSNQSANAKSNQAEGAGADPPWCSQP